MARSWTSSASCKLELKRVPAIATAVLVLSQEIVLVGTTALLDEWIYSWETIILGLACLSLIAGIFLGIQFGSSGTGRNGSWVFLVILNVFAAWRLVVTMNMYGGPGYYDPILSMVNYFSTPVSGFIASFYLAASARACITRSTGVPINGPCSPGIDANSNGKAIYRCIMTGASFPAGVVVSGFVSLLHQHVALYFGITGLLGLVAILPFTVGEKGGPVKPSLANESGVMRNDTTGRQIGEGFSNLVCKNGAMCTIMLGNLLFGMYFWKEIQANGIQISTGLVFPAYLLLASLGSLMGAIVAAGTRGVAITRLCLVVSMAILTWLLAACTSSGDTAVLQAGFVTSGLASGFAFHVIWRVLGCYRVKKGHEKRVATIAGRLVMAFGLVISQLGFVLAFAFNSGAVTSDVLLVVAGFVLVFGLLGAIPMRDVASTLARRAFHPRARGMVAACVFVALTISSISCGNMANHVNHRSLQDCASAGAGTIHGSDPPGDDVYSYNSTWFRSPFGSCVHNEITAGVIEDQKAAFFGWWRIDWRWDSFQKTGNTDWHFEEFDARVQWFNDNDIYMIPLLSYVPSWACNNTGMYCDALLEDWKNFVRTVVSRYAGNKSIPCWEIWNEPNINSEIYSDPLIYSILLATAAEIIREVDPKSLILAGGTSSMNLGNLGWYEKIFELNASGPAAVRGKIVFDVINLHLYQETYRGAIYEIMAIRDLARSRGFAVHPGGRGAIWITETGKPTRQQNWPADHEHQAEFLSKVAIGSRYAGIARIFYYVWYGEEYFGILHSEHKGKPAYYMLQLIHSLTFDSIPVPVDSMPAATREAMVLEPEHDVPVTVRVEGFNLAMNPNVHVFPFYRNTSAWQEVILACWTDQTALQGTGFRVASSTPAAAGMIYHHPARVVTWPPAGDSWLVPACNETIGEPGAWITLDSTMPRLYSVRFPHGIEIRVTIEVTPPVAILLLLVLGIIIIGVADIMITLRKRRCS
ncbi:MAG: cellulase family glycosylhydrolase [Candidatus Sigynarchaeota archaeon]